MNIFLDIEFPLEICRYSMQGGTLSSKQYLPYILDISPLSFNMGDDHTFEVSSVNILFDDIDNHFRSKFTDAINKNIEGSLAILYDESGNKVATLKVWEYEFLPDYKFSVTLSNKVGELWNDFTEKITLEEFANAPTDSINEVIPDCYGEMNAGTAGTIKAWQVEPNEYLINATDLTATAVLDAAYLEDGTDITASCALSTTADGLRTTVTYNVTNPDFIVVDFDDKIYKAVDVQDVLEANLNKWVTFNNGNYTPIAALDTFLSYTYSTFFRYYTNTAVKTGAELLKDFCDSHNVDWIVNTDNEIEIKYIDINNLTSEYTIQDGKAKEMNYSSSVDPEEYANKII